MTGSFTDMRAALGWSGYSETALGTSEPVRFDVAKVFSGYDGSQTIGLTTGHFRSVQLTSELQYFDCDLVAEDAFDMHQTLMPGLCIAVILRGQWSIHGPDLALQLEAPNVPFVLVVGDAIPVINSRAKGAHVRMAGLFISGSAVRRYASDEDPALHAVAALAKPGLSFHDFSSCRRISQILQRMYDNPYKGEMSHIYLQGLGYSLLVELGSHLLGGREHVCFDNRRAREIAFDARRIIEDNLFSMPSVPELAKMLETNVSTLRRAFKAQIGYSVVSYVRERRLQAAQLLLRKRQLQISQVAYQVGYSSPANFSIAYKARFGYPPTRE